MNLESRASPAVADAPWLIVGCGYTGERIAERVLTAGRPLWLTRRDPIEADRQATALGRGARGLGLGLGADPRGFLSQVPPGAMVVVLAPPLDDTGAGETALLAALRSPRQVIYMSSTGVYGPGAGAWVDEDWPLVPASVTGRHRVAAESAVRRTTEAAAIPWTILRPAGIYGRGRGPLARLRAGDYRIVGDGATAVSRIHVEDLASAVVLAAAPPAHGRIYNVADDEPCSAAALGDALALRLGLPPPPRVPTADVSAEVSAMLTADRRISNRRIKAELGLTLLYPTWRDGIAAEL